MSRHALTLVSHHLCPYVQRAVIALSEKQVPFERVYIDLADKPDWFLEISPLGKVPVLLAGDRAIFESAVILEYLEETQPRPLHPADPLARAEHRAWIEFASQLLNTIAAFYSAGDAESFETRRRELAERFARLEEKLGEGPWFAGGTFGLVDAAFGPVFRYFDVFDQIADFGVFEDKPGTLAWRRALAGRSSVAGAVAPDYGQRLMRFLQRRRSRLSAMLVQAA